MARVDVEAVRAPKGRTAPGSEERVLFHTRQVQIRLRPEWHDRARELATAEGDSLSAWTRRLIVREIRKADGERD